MTTASERRVSVHSGQTAHIKAPGCIVNVFTGLHDDRGREVTTIEVRCDAAGGQDDCWSMPALCGERVTVIRVVRGYDDEAEATRPLPLGGAVDNLVEEVVDRELGWDDD